MVLRRTSNEHRVVGVGLDMLLQILRPLERLAAKLAFVRLQGHMNTDVRRDMVALHRRGAALIPLARQVQVVGALAANMLVTDVLLHGAGCISNMLSGGERNRYKMVDVLT